MARQSTISGSMGEGLNPAVVAGDWPAALQEWFGRLMTGKPRKRPDVSPAAWKAWLESAEKHGLSSLLFSRLRHCESAAHPPAEILSALRAAYFEDAARIMIRRTQLDILLNRLESAGIEALVLKGAALGEVVYHDVFQRPSADIDILVARADYEAARTTLLENGYRSKRGDRTRQMDWSCDEEFMPAEGDEERQYVVELHWSLSSHAQLVDRIEAAAVIGRSDRAGGGKRPYRVLNLVDALVFACIHLFYKHINELRLIWLYDVHLLAQQIENRGLWYEVIALSQDWQARLALQQCLQLAHHWFKTPYPDDLNDPDYKPASLEELEMFNLAMYQLEHGRREGWLKKHLFQLYRLKGRNKFRYLKSRLFPTRQEIEANYPRLRLWPGPLVHIGRLAMMIVSKK
jgi:hypothetical protein